MKRRVAIFFVLLSTILPRALHAWEQRSLDGPQPKFRVSIPNEKWGVEIDAPGFVNEYAGPRADGNEYLHVKNQSTQLVLFIVLERPAAGAKTKSCPEYLQGLVKSEPEAAKFAKEMQIGLFDVFEFNFPVSRVSGRAREQFMGCAERDGVYIALYLKKEFVQPADEHIFTDVLEQVRLVDLSIDSPSVGSPAASQEPGSQERTSMDYLREGNELYIMEDYSDAIVPYQKALDLEKKNPQLTKTNWLNLIDNLGMAYGLTGDLDHAEQVLEYGVSKEPEYPLFYYNLACTYAEQKNIGKAMEYLKMAFARKAHVIPGETMPDPREDDSFHDFMKDKKFREFVDAMMAEK